MSLNCNPHYNALCEQTNPYLAVMQIASEARALCDLLPNRILESTALDYASKGITPDPKDFPDHRLNRVKEYLNYVEDIEVKSAVIGSYEASLHKNNLVYDYGVIVDESRKTRVRIIMNILWDKRPHRTY